MALNFFKIAKGLFIKPRSSAPTSPAEGDIYVDSTDNKVVAYLNSAWRKLVGQDDSETLSNKSLVDSTTTFESVGDNTKKVRIIATDITTGNTRDLHVPDETGTLVLNNNSAVLKNKDLDDSSIEFVHALDATAKVKFDLQDISASTVRTYTCPDASGELVLDTKEQTLTNKTIDSSVVTDSTVDLGTASNSQKLVLPANTSANLDALTDEEASLAYDTDQDAVVFNNGSGWNTIGSGQGGINYVTNSDFEGGISDWNTYADAAGSTPVDGTGGSANITITQNTSSPLRGGADLKITKDAVNRQGEGFSTEISIDPADYNKLMTVSFDVDASQDSGYTAGDLAVYLIRDTGGTPTLVTPNVVNIAAAKYKFEASFVTTEDDDWRLCIHVASTTTSAWTTGIFFDNFQVGPQEFISATPTTDFDTVTVTGSWSNITYSAKRKRVGDNAKFKVYMAASSGNTDGALLITLPNDHTIDTAKLPSGGSTDDTTLGTGSLYDSSSATSYYLRVAYYSTTQVAVYYTAASGSLSGIRTTLVHNAPVTIASGDKVFLEFEVPIAEWANSANYANSQVEYAFNTSTNTSSDDTSSFGYGPQGAPITNISSSLSRRVRFTSSIQPTDTIILQVSSDQTTWLSLPAETSDIIAPLGNNGTNSFGVWWTQVNDTDVDVNFFNKRWAANDWSAVQNDYWRVVKSSNPISVASKHPYSMIRLHTPNGHGSTNNKIRRFSTVVTNQGGAIAYADSATDGASFTINEAGVYSMSYSDSSSTGIAAFGFSVNSTELTTSIASITAEDRLMLSSNTAAGEYGLASVTVILNKGDVIRPHTNGGPDSSIARGMFVITQVFPY